MESHNHDLDSPTLSRKPDSEPAPAKILPYRHPGSERTGPPPSVQVAPPAPTDPAALFHCGVKGCVYPSRRESPGCCLYHWLQEQDPKLFASLQPSSLLLDQARFGLPDTEPDDSRVVDRTRRLLERAAFQLDDAA